KAARRRAARCRRCRWSRSSRDRLIARAQPLTVARTRASAFALLHGIVADEEERDQRARKFDQRAAEIGDAQSVMRRGGLLRYFGSLSGSPTYHAAAPPRPSVPREGCVRRRAGGQGASGQGVGSCDARLHLRDLRQPIYALGRAAAVLPDL